MPMSPLHAWTIFKSAHLEQEQGINAIAGLVGEEATEYHTHAENFQASLAEKIIEVHNEAAALLTDHPVTQRLEFTPAHEYTAADYRDLVTIFEGSQHEKLHLTGFFRIQNAELLLDLVKPAA